MSTPPQKQLATFATVVGAVLVELRFRTNLRQSDLAAAAGVAQPTWSRIERGEGDLTVDQLVTIGRELKLSSGFVLNVAEDVAERLERHEITVEWHRGDLTQTVSELSQVLGVADLSDHVRKVMAKEKYGDEFLKRVFRSMIVPPHDRSGRPAEATLSKPHAAGIGRRVRPKPPRG